MRPQASKCAQHQKNFLFSQATGELPHFSTFHLTRLDNYQQPAPIPHPSRILGYHYHIVLKAFPSYQDTPCHLSLSLNQARPYSPYRPPRPTFTIDNSFSWLLQWRLAAVPVSRLRLQYPVAAVPASGVRTLQLPNQNIKRKRTHGGKFHDHSPVSGRPSTLFRPPPTKTPVSGMPMPL